MLSEVEASLIFSSGDALRTGATIRDASTHSTPLRARLSLSRTKPERRVIEVTLTAVLLAGGESKRMGRDKAEIIIRGQPLWQRQIDLLRSLRPEKILVSAREEPAWLPLGTDLLLDEPPSRGPLSGLTKALGRMQTTHLAVLAIDMPFMTSEQMHVLWSLTTIGCGVLPMIAARAEPLAAIYPREVAADFAAALSGSDYSLQTLTKNLARAGKVQTWDVPDEARDFFRSVNEPGDLALEA